MVILCKPQWDRCNNPNTILKYFVYRFEKIHNLDIRVECPKFDDSDRATRKAICCRSRRHEELVVYTNAGSPQSVPTILVF